MLTRLSIVAALLLAACSSSPKPVAPVSQAEKERIARHGLAAEFIPSIDRLTFFGRERGSNMLHLSSLERDVPTDGSYTFWGGCYTWVSPQRGVEGVIPGWVGEDRVTPQDWPPDPAMDVGPARRASREAGSFGFIGPDHRTGLREEKTFRIVARDVAVFEYTLHNRGAAARSAGTWTNLAVSRNDVIAVRLTGSTRIHGWDESGTERLRSIMGEPDARGWALINLRRAKWDGGIKVYFSPAPGEAAREVEIAVWRRNVGAWLYRSLGRMTAEDAAMLDAAGEGPVAVYIQPKGDDGPIIEAELYGPIREIPPDSSATTRETWRIIPALRAETAALP